MIPKLGCTCVQQKENTPPWCSPRPPPPPTRTQCSNTSTESRAGSVWYNVTVPGNRELRIARLPREQVVLLLWSLSACVWRLLLTIAKMLVLSSACYVLLCMHTQQTAAHTRYTKIIRTMIGRVEFSETTPRNGAFVNRINKYLCGSVVSYVCSLSLLPFSVFFFPFSFSFSVLWSFY